MKQLNIIMLMFFFFFLFIFTAVNYIYYQSQRRQLFSIFIHDFSENYDRSNEYIKQKEKKKKD